MMNIEEYAITSDRSRMSYKFQSVGPKGIIRKIVRYSNLKNVGIDYYNLSFGDWNEADGLIDDHNVSDNKDTYKILYAVANTVLRFLEYFPEAKILILASTRSRMRLYQIAIVKNMTEIIKHIELEGFTKGQLKKFEAGINYDALLIRSKKKLVNLLKPNDVKRSD